MDFGYQCVCVCTKEPAKSEDNCLTVVITSVHNHTLGNVEQQKIPLTPFFIDHIYFCSFPPFHLMKSGDIS